MKNPPNKFLLLLTTLLIVPLTGMGIDVYVPSLPAITKHFMVDSSYIQLTVGLYMFSYGFSQVIIGPMSDSIGRRKLLLIGLLLFAIACLLVPFVKNIYLLLLLRVAQGVTVAFAGAVTKAIFPDCFRGEALAKYINYQTIFWALGPIVAPVIGGYLQHYFGWHAPFYFLSIYASVMLLLAFLFIPETVQQRSEFHFKQIFHNYKTLFSNANFIKFATIAGLIYGLMTTFNVIGPYLIQVVLHKSAVYYGHVALLLGLAWFMGNISNRAITRWFSITKIVLVNLWLMLIISILMATIALTGYISISVIVIPTVALFYLGGIVFPNLFAKCMGLFSHLGGTVGSGMGAMFVFIAGGMSVIASLLKLHSQLPMSIAYFVLMLMCMLLYSRLLRLREIKESES